MLKVFKSGDRIMCGEPNHKVYCIVLNNMPMSSMYLLKDVKSKNVWMKSNGLPTWFEPWDLDPNNLLKELL